MGKTATGGVRPECFDRFDLCNGLSPLVMLRARSSPSVSSAVAFFETGAGFFTCSDVKHGPMSSACSAPSVGSRKANAELRSEAIEKLYSQLRTTNTVYLVGAVSKLHLALEKD